MKDKHNMLIDCRSKNCNLKYESIAENYKAIDSGEAIQLITNSDPQNLFYEMLSKEKGNFHWVTLEDGPKEWNILIEKTFSM